MASMCTCRHYISRDGAVLGFMDSQDIKTSQVGDRHTMLGVRGHRKEVVSWFWFGIHLVNGQVSKKLLGAHGKENKQTKQTLPESTRFLYVKNKAFPVAEHRASCRERSLHSVLQAALKNFYLLQRHHSKPVSSKTWVLSLHMPHGNRDLPHG